MNVTLWHFLGPIILMTPLAVVTITLAVKYGFRKAEREAEQALVRIH